MRTFKLQAGVQELLSLALEHSVAEKITKWKSDVARGEIDEDTRSAFVAFGWITPRDGRVLAQRVPTERPARTKPEIGADTGR